MSQMETIFLPGGFIALMFVLYWVVAYPTEMFRCMMMRSGETEGNIAGIFTWMFIIISVITVGYTIKKLIG